MPKITESRILILATDGFEKSELFVPLEKLKEAGAKVVVAAPEKRAIKSWDKKDWGETIDADCAAADVDISDYDALVLPGGQINPDLLRVDTDAMAVVKTFLKSGKVVAAICHAPWLLAEAGVLDGRDVTSYPSIKTDLINAGANWRDAEVVADKGIVTSRSPGDLDAFVSKIVEEVEEGRHEERKLAA